MLIEQLGSKDDDVSFLTGILFAPSFVTTTVPHLQNTFMADACHLNFGKYTLFRATELQLTLILHLSLLHFFLVMRIL